MMSWFSKFPGGSRGQCGPWFNEEMEGAAKLMVPLKVDLNVADNWMDMK